MYTLSTSNFLITTSCVLCIVYNFSSPHTDATTYEDAFLLKDHLFETQPGVNDYMEWRDSRVLDEIQWYGWHIDYWMEGGLLRDVFTHKMTTAEHWDRIMNMPFFSRGDLAYENYVPGGEESVTPTYDTHCPGDITGGCEVSYLKVEMLLLLCE